MKIIKEDLLEIISILSDKIKSSMNESIEIDDEVYFWEISEDDFFDVFNKVPDLLIGNTKDEWQELLRLKEVEEIPISYDLKRLSIILQLIRKNSRSTW